MEYTKQDFAAMNEARKIRHQRKVLEKSTYYLGFNKS